jgi:hypothetical protein
MKPKEERRNSKKPRLEEIPRWEGEGGAPPNKLEDPGGKRRNFYEDPGPAIVNILRRLFKSWRGQQVSFAG